MKPQLQGILFVLGLIVFLHLQANFTIVTAAFLLVLCLVIYLYYTKENTLAASEAGKILKSSDPGLESVLEQFALFREFDVQTYTEVMAGLDHFFSLYARVLLNKDQQHRSRDIFDLMWDTRKDIVNNMYGLIFKSSKITGEDVDALVKPVIAATMKCLKVLAKKDEQLRERLVELRMALREQTAYDIF